MGSEQNFEYTVIGDHVNLASRLEGLTKAYGAPIVTSRFTFDCIEKSGLSLPHHRVLDLVKVKGKHQAVELIQILDHEVSAEDLASFETAKVKYRAQAWDEAIDIFSKLSPSDPTSAMFLERCREFKDNPPADGWDGSWEMHEK